MCQDELTTTGPFLPSRPLLNVGLPRGRHPPPPQSRRVSPPQLVARSLRSSPYSSTTGANDNTLLHHPPSHGIHRSTKLNLVHSSKSTKLNLVHSSSTRQQLSINIQQTSNKLANINKPYRPTHNADHPRSIWLVLRADDSRECDVPHWSHDYAPYANTNAATHSC